MWLLFFFLLVVFAYLIGRAVAYQLIPQRDTAISNEAMISIAQLRLLVETGRAALLLESWLDPISSDVAVPDIEDIPRSLRQCDIKELIGDCKERSSRSELIHLRAQLTLQLISIGPATSEEAQRLLIRAEAYWTCAQMAPDPSHALLGITPVWLAHMAWMIMTRISASTLGISMIGQRTKAFSSQVTCLTRQYYTFQAMQKRLSAVGSPPLFNPVRLHEAIDASKFQPIGVLRRPQIFMPRPNNGGLLGRSVGCFCSMPSRCLIQLNDVVDAQGTVTKAPPDYAINIMPFVKVMDSPQTLRSFTSKQDGWQAHFEDDTYPGVCTSRDALILSFLCHISTKIKEPYFHTIWMGYHLPPKERFEAIATTRMNGLTSTQTHVIQRAIGGTFAYLLHNFGAQFYLNRLASATESFQHMTDNIDVWMMKQDPHRQLSLYFPIFYSDYHN